MIKCSRTVSFKSNVCHCCFCSDGGRKIQNIQPFTKKDLDSAGLGDRIRDISCITYVYPDFPKTDVFKKFFTGK